MYDIIIIGGGPAGVAAGVYAGRKQLKTLFLTESFGGQSVVSTTIENWIGDISLSGFSLGKKLEAHLRVQETVEIKKPEKAISLSKMDNIFFVKTDKGNVYESKTVIITAGGRHRRLGVPGEDLFDGKGVAYCSTCDAPLFRDKDVVVVGGGNSGLEAVQDLIPFAKSIIILNRDSELKGDQITQKDIFSSSKVTVIHNADTQEIIGDAFVTGLRYKDLKTNNSHTLLVQGVFVEIGVVPNSEFVKDFLELDKYGQIKINHRTAETSIPGVFAAGDITDEAFKQNNIAVGDAVTALLSAYEYLKKNK